ncbi:MAG: large conductance mechanosensitive channel protein MscL [Rhodocyclaceae bacterium]|nr:large conductance mechanosensitive channel protein MscL [Rhodocyclaceae bacterium]
MSFIKEFKEFAMRGNVIDLAVAVVVGGAFGKIVDSLVSDIIMPMVGRLIGGIDFSHFYFDLSFGDYASMEAAEKAGAPLLKYGLFVNNIINFLIIALAIFVAVKLITKLRREEPPAPAPAPEDPQDVQLLREIRDLLKDQRAGNTGTPNA